MAGYNKCYFEGTLWEPTLKTSTNGRSTWSANLSVYKRKNEDGKTEYTKVWLRAYGTQAEAFQKSWKHGDKVHVYATYRNEPYNGKYYNFFVAESIGPQPVQNNSPYAQNYQRPQATQGTFQREIPDAVEIQEDELPF